MKRASHRSQTAGPLYANEHGLYLFNATGTVSVQATTITDAEETLLHVDDNTSDGSTLTLNVRTTSACTFSHGAALGNLSAFTDRRFSSLHAGPAATR